MSLPTMPSWVSGPGWARVSACSVSAACFALVASSCTTTVILTGPAGAAACVGTLAGATAFGCKESLTNCAGKRRLLTGPKY